MRNFLAFLGIGSFFATVEEFLTVVVLKKDVGAYVVTLLILFPALLTAVYFGSKLIDRWTERECARELIHFFLFGCAGLMFEWFVMGLTPWSNRDGAPLAVFVFQTGMFSFWATVTFAPRLFLNPSPLSQKTKRAILRFYIPYFLIVYGIGLSVPEPQRFITIISSIIFGHMVLVGIFAGYFWLAFRASVAGTDPTH